MLLRIRNLQDFWSGVFFIALGLLAIWLSRDYPMGSASQPGPGYFPVWLGGIMTVLGAIIGGASLKLQGDPGERLELREWGFRPWLVLPLTLAVYAMLMEADFGFVPSLVVLIVGCALAHKDVHWRETILLSVFLTAGAVAIFIYGLELPYPLFWWNR
jgi:hypothetical protein